MCTCTLSQDRGDHLRGGALSQWHLQADPRHHTLQLSGASQHQVTAHTDWSGHVCHTHRAVSSTAQTAVAKCTCR